MQPGVLEVLEDDEGDEDEPEKYNIQFHFTDDDGIPYVNTEYIAYFASGTQKKGLTDKKGYTERFVSNNADSVEIKLALDFQNG